MAFTSGHQVHNFCRHQLAEVMKEARKHYTPLQLKSAWAWSAGRGNFEFHGPSGEYVYNLKMADCKWGALAEGWQRMIEAKRILKGIPEARKKA